MLFSRIRPFSTFDSVRLSRIGACVLAFAAMSAPGLAEVVTLPAAASIVGAAPFFSDVRAFKAVTLTRYAGATHAANFVAPRPQRMIFE